MFQTYVCSKENHQNSEIIAVCCYLCCLQSRLMCQFCVDYEVHKRDIDYNRANILLIQSLNEKFEIFKIQHIQFIESKILSFLIESKYKILKVKDLLNRELETFTIYQQTLKDLRELSASSQNIEFSDWFTSISEQNSLNKYLHKIQDQVNEVIEKSGFLGVSSFNMNQNEHTQDIGQAIGSMTQMIENQIKQNKIYTKLIKDESTVELEFLLNQVQQQLDKEACIQEIESKIQYGINNPTIIADQNDYCYLQAYCCILKKDYHKAKGYLNEIQASSIKLRKGYFIQGIIQMDEKNYEQEIQLFQKSSEILCLKYKQIIIRKCVILAQNGQMKIKYQKPWNANDDQYTTKQLLLIEGEHYQKNYNYNYFFETFNQLLILYSNDFYYIKKIYIYLYLYRQCLQFFQRVQQCLENIGTIQQ